MQTSKQLENILQTAIILGYTVERSRSCIDVFKVDKTKQPVKVSGKNVYPIGLGVRIYEDKTARRLDVSVDSALVIRTYKEVKKILKIYDTHDYYLIKTNR